MVRIFKSGAMIFSYPYFSKSVGIGSMQFETVCKIVQPFETCICGAKTNQAPMVHSGTISYFQYKKCSHKTSKAISRLRMSSHGLNIEAGRYGAEYKSKHNRCCPTCTDLETLELILELPGEHNPIIED